ncbi:MAG TPA: Zn-ribbon domain-containing OB-fold protein [Acidobacteriota bacterium]
MDLPRYHRLRPAYYRLEGQRCGACGAVQFPPRGSCRECGEGPLVAHRLSGRGEVYSFTEVAQAPEGFEAPYLAALIRLEEGFLITAQLTDIEAEEVRIGLPVEMVTRRIREHGEQGYLVYGYKFRPLLHAAPVAPAMGS